MSIEAFKKEAEKVRFMGNRKDIVETKLDDPRLAPFRSNDTDAGADLRSKESHSIARNCTLLVNTGVALKIPVGYVGLVVPRSSMGKVRVTLANGTGVIDSDYRGNIKVLLANDGNETFRIEAFDTRIAQILIIPVMLAKFECTNEDNWFDTTRGTGGFGSTGK